MRKSTRKGCLWAISLLLLIFPIFFLIELEDYYRWALDRMRQKRIHPYRSAKSPNVKVQSIEWRLNVAGEVDNPILLSLKEIKSIPYTGFSVRNSGKQPRQYRGVPFETLAELCQPREGTARVFFRDTRSRRREFTIEELIKGHAVLVYEIDGKPLSSEHGKPLRLVFSKEPDREGVEQIVEIIFRGGS